MKDSAQSLSPVSAREVFAYQLARRGYDPNLGATKDALDAFDAAVGFAFAQRPADAILRQIDAASFVDGTMHEAIRAAKDYVAALSDTSTVHHPGRKD